MTSAVLKLFSPFKSLVLSSNAVTQCKKRYEYQLGRKASIQHNKLGIFTYVYSISV